MCGHLIADHYWTPPYLGEYLSGVGIRTIGLLSVKLSSAAIRQAEVDMADQLSPLFYCIQPVKQYGEGQCCRGGEQPQVRGSAQGGIGARPPSVRYRHNPWRSNQRVACEGLGVSRFAKCPRLY